MIEKLHSQMVARLVKPGKRIMRSLTPSRVNLWHAATGLAGEAGEFLDAVKKWVIYNKALDRKNAIEEMGDLEFYMEQARQELGITREDCLAANMEKLADKDKGRYAKGYTDKAAQLRKDKA